MERGCLSAVGVAVALFSGLFATMFAVQAATGGDGKTSVGVLVGLVVFFTGTFVAGAYLAWRMLQAKPAESEAARPTARPRGSAGPTRQQRPGSESAEPVAESPEPAGPAEMTDIDHERRVLLLAEKENGRVTVPEVAVHCNLTVVEAKTILDRMVVQEVAELQVTGNGVLVYVFLGFLSDDDKAHASDF